MFSPETFVIEKGLTQQYFYPAWSNPPVVPDSVEFLEAQDVLLYGGFYIAESPQRAADFFSGGDKLVSDGAFLAVAGADAREPEWRAGAYPLTVLGVSESAGRIFNAYSAWRSDMLERSRVQPFEKIWGRMLENDTLSEPELQNILEVYLDVNARYFQVAVISTLDEELLLSDSPILGSIRAMIPHCQTVVSKREIVIVMAHNEYCRGCPCDEHRMTEALTENGTRMALSLTTGFLRDLRPLYRFCQHALTTAKALESGHRILFANSYAVYNLIELAVKQYYTEFGDYNGIMLLAHPAIVRLYHYDAENGDNLSEVLYHYLFCDCNAARAASSLFMHRNTIVNKIRKITELTGEDFSDNGTRQLLLYSCQLARYVQKILKIKPS